MPRWQECQSQSPGVVIAGIVGDAKFQSIPVSSPVVAVDTAPLEATTTLTRAVCAHS